jgi:hypothetical protein
MNNQENMDDDVMNILAILQQQPTVMPVESKKVEKKAISSKKVESAKKETPSVKTGFEKPDVSLVVKPETQNPKLKTSFMADINEPEDKSIYNSKVLIREEIYEIFMSLKRTKKFKSVSTLIDFALEDYIKRHKEDIKKTLFESKKQGIL